MICKVIKKNLLGNGTWVSCTPITNLYKVLQAITGLKVGNTLGPNGTPNRAPDI
jgi:hypothetical protein